MPWCCAYVPHRRCDDGAAHGDRGACDEAAAIDLATGTSSCADTGYAAGTA